MAVIEIAVAPWGLNSKLFVITKKFVWGGDPDVVFININATQTSVRTSTREINFTGIPVNMLLKLLFLKINGVNATMAFALLAASNYRCRNKRR